MLLSSNPREARPLRDLHTNRQLPGGGRSIDEKHVMPSLSGLADPPDNSLKIGSPLGANLQTGNNAARTSYCLI